MPTAAKPAATAASLATRFRVEVLGRTDFFDFAGRMAFVVLLVFDLASARFKLVFDLTRRFDEVLDLARFFAFFMISPVRFDLVQIGLQSYCWQAVGMDFPLSATEVRRARRERVKFFNDFDDGAGPWSARDRVRSHGRRAGGNNFIRTRVGHFARVVLHHEGFVKKGIQS